VAVGTGVILGNTSNVGNGTGVGVGSTVGVGSGSGVGVGVGTAVGIGVGLGDSRSGTNGVGVALPPHATRATVTSATMKNFIINLPLGVSFKFCIGFSVSS
jgi:hypothetical protein